MTPELVEHLHSTLKLYTGIGIVGLLVLAVAIWVTRVAILKAISQAGERELVNLKQEGQREIETMRARAAVDLERVKTELTLDAETRREVARRRVDLLVKLNKLVFEVRIGDVKEEAIKRVISEYLRQAWYNEGLFAESVSKGLRSGMEAMLEGASNKEKREAAERILAIIRTQLGTDVVPAVDPPKA
jgi:hypothetical protein